MFENLFKTGGEISLPKGGNMFEGLFPEGKTTSSLAIKEQPLERTSRMATLGITIPKTIKTSTEAIVDEEIPNLFSTLKTIQESISKSGASVGLTITAPFTGKREITSEELRPGFERTFKEFIFGKEPIKAIETRIAETELTLKEKGLELPAIGKVEVKGKELPFAIAGVGATIGLDFTGWGGGKSSVIKLLAKTNKIDEVVNILRKIGVAEDLVGDYSKVIAETTKTTEVAKALSRIEEIQKTTKVAPRIAPEAPKALPEAIPPEKGIIPQELQPLAQEARKYKSAEEFVKQFELHGGASKLEGGKLSIKFDKSGGIFTTPSEKTAETWRALRNGKIYQVYLGDKKLIDLTEPKTVKKIEGLIGTKYTVDGEVSIFTKNDYDFLFPDGQADWATFSNYIPMFEKMGYKGAKIREGFNVNTSLWEDIKPLNEVMTKSQLTDFYNQAVKGVKEVKPEGRVFLTPPLKGAMAITEGEIADKVGRGVVKGFKWRERGFIKSIKRELPDLATKPLGEEIRIAGQYIPRSTDRLAIKARTLIQTDIKTAEKIAMTRTDDSAVAVGAELLKYYSDEALKSGNQIVRDTLFEKAANLANDMAQKLTEQGRSVQAASILGRLTPEGQLKFAAREIQKYNEEIIRTKGGILGLKKKIPELTEIQAKEIATEMKAIQEMADGTEKAMRFQKLQNNISDLIPSPLFKKLTTIWKAGLLTGIKTSGLNIFANISHAAGTEIIKDIPATMVDKIVSLFTKKRAVVFTIKGIFGGGKEGAEKGWRYLTTGFDERNIGVKLDYHRINFGKGKLAKVLQTYTDSVFKVLGTEDQPFYYATKLRSLYEQAKVAAINKGLKRNEAQKFINDLIQNPTEEMIKYASYDAETAVFQNKTLLGQAARAIQQIPGGEIIVPFGRTPSAVAMQIFNYSPLGIIKTIFENVGKGRFDQRLFSQGLGRGLTGTGMLALGALLYKKGMMTLARPTGEKEQKLWEQEGRIANSIKIGGKWRTVQILGPVGNVMLIGGYFQQEFSKKGSPTEAMTNVLAGASKSFTQQTFLTGVSNFIDAVSDPARSAENVAGSTLASTIPTIVSDISRATDDRERRANEILEKFQARIPGIRETLEPQITVLGEEKERVGNPLEVMADPTRPSPEKSNPVTQELRRLWDLNIKVSPTLLGDKKGYKGLTPGQNTMLWKKAGEITYGKLSSLLKNDAYQKMSDDEKGKIIENITDKSKLVARAGMVIKLTEGLSGEELKIKLSELKKSGLMTREVYNKFIELR